MEQYFDEDSILRYGESLGRMVADLRKKVRQEREGAAEQFERGDWFEKVERALEGKGRARFGKMEPMNPDRFQMLEELSQSVRSGEAANLE